MSERIQTSKALFIRVRLDLPNGVRFDQNGTLLVMSLSDDAALELSALLRGMAREIDTAIGDE